MSDTQDSEPIEKKVIVREITWRDADGFCYRKYVLPDGRTIRIETFELWPFFTVGEV